LIDYLSELIKQEIIIQLVLKMIKILDQGVEGFEGEMSAKKYINYKNFKSYSH
jgi:hypothetical protein